MTVFQEDCPHCGTRSVAFTMVQQFHATKVEGHLWDTLCYCANCSRSILATIRTPDGQKPGNYLSGTQHEKLRWEGIVPSLPDTEAPDHVPSNVARFYEQGMENLPGNWDAAGAMFRKALETGLKRKFPDIQGDLYKRIEKAAEQHKLTPDLAEWSHQVRLGGREAVHEEEPYSKAEAERLSTFTRAACKTLMDSERRKNTRASNDVRARQLVRF